MHDYNTILGVIELRLSKVSYDAVQKRYRIGRSGIALIMNRYDDSGLSLDDLRQMPPAKVVDLIYPKENLRHKDIPLPDFEKIHEQMIQMGKHADLSFLWIDYKKEHPNVHIPQELRIRSSGTDAQFLRNMQPLILVLEI